MEPHALGSKKTTAGWVFGGLSFIPLIGVLFGIIAIIIGVAKKSKGPALLGLCGILVTVVLYGGLYYFGFVQKGSVYDDLRTQLVSQLMSNNAGQISLYKDKNSKLPAKLSDLGTPSPTNLLYLVDPWGTAFVYEVNADGTTFKLTSAGPDKALGTEDDIYNKY